MHTQKDFARFLVEKKHADYCFTIKNNQRMLKTDVADLNLEKNLST
jgi:predicted transposase YbfD/YdcC